MYIMDTRLKNILWEGEEVRWSGRPKPFSLFDHDSKNSILLTWIVSALVLAAVIVLMVFSSITGTRSFTDVLIMAIVALFLRVALSARPFMDKKCLEKNTLYAITNFRIIALVKGEVMYLPLVKGIKTAVQSHEDGFGSLRFGELVGKPAKKSRDHAVIGMRNVDSREDMAGLMFYHIDQPGQLLRYLA